MSNENKAIAKRWFDEVWNNGNASAIRELLAEDVLIHGLVDSTGAPVKGVKGFETFHAQFRGAFPNIMITVEDMIAEGDKVAVRCNVKAKHSGDSLGISATHNDVEFTGIAILRVHNGQLAEGWNNFDFLEMNRQLGIV